MWRAPLRGFLLVLVVVGVALLSLGLWARYTVYDEDQFVSVVSGISSDPAVQDLAVVKIMSEIDRAIEERTASQSLSPTVGITYQMFKPQIQSGLTTVMASPDFQKIWQDALREIHGPFTSLLKGDTTVELDETDNQVRVNLYPAYLQARTKLPDKANQLLDQVNISEDSLWIPVMKGERLIELQDYVKLFNRLLAIGIIVSVLSAIGYVLLSSHKLRSIAWLLLAIAVGWIIQRALLEIARNQLVESLKTDKERDVAQVFYDTLTNDLRQLELYGIIAAIVIAVVIYLVDRYQSKNQTPQIEGWV